MRIFLFIFLLTLNVTAQSPATANLFAEGTRSANAGKFNEALKSYKTTLFMAENEDVAKGYLARVHYNVGVCHLQMNQPERAASEFKIAMRLNNGDYPRALYALGMAEAQMENWIAAATSFERVVKLDAKNGEAWFDLAFANVALNKFETAEAAFARSIEFGSVDAALSHNNIGVILAVKGDLMSAERSFETAIAMSGGRLDEAKRNLEFCRAKRLGRERLVAGDFRYSTRGVRFDFG